MVLKMKRKNADGYEATSPTQRIASLILNDDWVFHSSIAIECQLYALT